MRSLASAVLVMTAIGMGAPALAAEPMGAHQAPASMPAGAAHQDRDRDHDGDRHHRHGILLPFEFFVQAPVPQVVVVQPDEASSAPAAVPATPAADLPPCQETSAGVLILRGTGCTR